MRQRKFGDYLRRKFGHPVYRVPIELPVGCPHRAADGSGGCAFCGDDGARARHLRPGAPLAEQVAGGVNYIRRRYGPDNGLAAYFQAFTSTDTTPEKLRRWISEVLDAAGFDAVIIGTRPDCLPEGMLALLTELAAGIELWVELGVQSADDATLARVNRGHDFAAVERAAAALAAENIKVAAHVILGLPGEGGRDFIRTAEKIAALPFAAVKIHNLLVLKDSPLAAEYAANPFPTMNEYEYAAALRDFLNHLPEDWLVMRLTADADPGNVAAPKWLMDKGRFLAYLASLEDRPAGPVVMTADGSLTAYHPVYRQHFHSLAGAAAEAENKFIIPSRLRERLEAGDTRLLDIGFGLGYNAVAAAAAARDVGGGELDIISIERDPQTLALAAETHRDDSAAGIIRGLRGNGRWQEGGVRIQLIAGDARQSVKLLPDGWFDVIFLDAFSPDRNPELWTYDFLRLTVRKLAPGGALVTYSASLSVRGALLRLGMTVGNTKAFGRRRPGTIASPDAVEIAEPLSRRELEIITKSTAGLAYRDPCLSAAPGEIHAWRRKLTARLRRRGVPKWFKSSVSR